MKRHSSFGFIYVLSNMAMPDCYKVGMTEVSPHHRAQQLSNETGIPEPFSVEYYAEVDRVATYERLVHQALAEFRVSPNREFFKCDVMTIVAAIRNPTGDEFGDVVPYCESLVSTTVHTLDHLAKKPAVLASEYNHGAEGAIH